MHFSAFVVLAALMAGVTVHAALPKANEYKSGDCSGPINFGHHSILLRDVTMDDTSHSVYLAGTNWVGYSDKTGNGGSCTGAALRILNGKCNNLDTADPGTRIRCVRNIG
ncbi:hypothetical protein DTO166G4_5452 [Paecilomyces variotii]|nr:hypothetical protein DTO166G4_5452 [Paecilomyces variotii]KAJ9236133.1 hypothetical protein DTO166G5_4178 [Paecilomyces variotii]KAJ9254753.1 hypothetical protein DTO195F2_6509 [Paecilomyces variotii]KAJ9367053.1 hypothetical protein DTO282E5_8238 [Paecilomyces variotii]